MRDYNLLQRAGHALTEVNTDSPEKTLAEDLLLEIDIFRHAVEVIDGNFPREQVKEVYEKFMDLWRKGLSEYCQLKYGVHDMGREIEDIKQSIQTVESLYYSYKNKEEHLQTQIEICGYFHPFRKAELKRELAELRKEGEPELPKALYSELREKTQECIKKQNLLNALDKDFAKLEQISKKLEDKLNPAQELTQSIKAKRHR